MYIRRETCREEGRSVPAPHDTTSGVTRGHVTALRRERSARSGRACGGERGAGAGGAESIDAKWRRSCGNRAV
ncbi:unnamed protein product [Ectocarpus sp. 4 AP-2014]